jgi:WD40 repeat protein
VLALAYSPDGKTIMTGSFDNTARLWDAATGKPRGLELRHPGRVRCVAFSSDGQILATGCAVEEAEPSTGIRNVSGGEVRLWKAATGERLGNTLWHPQPVWAVAFRPGGGHLLTGARDRSARFFLLPHGLLVGRPLDHEGTVAKVLFSPDGKQAVTASAGGDHSANARLWELPEQSSATDLTFLARIGGPNDSVAALTPDGSAAYLVNGKSVRLHDLVTGKPIGPVLVHRDSIRGNGCVCSSDGRTLLTCSYNNLVQFWDRPSGRKLGECRLNSAVAHAGFSTEERTATIGCADQTVQIRDVDTGKVVEPIRPHSPHFPGLFNVSADGRFVFTRETVDRCRMFDPTSGVSLGAMQAPGPINRVAFIGDRPVLALGEGSRLVQIWDPQMRRTIGTPLAELTGTTSALTFTPDGRMILTGSWERKQAQLWDAATGKAIGPPLLHGDAVHQVAFTANGRKMVSASVNTEIRRAEVPTPIAGSSERVRCWIELLTGKGLDAQASVWKLSSDALRRRRERLQELGGPPL